MVLRFVAKPANKEETPCTEHSSPVEEPTLE